MRKVVDFETQRELVELAIAQLPARFGLRAFPGETFRPGSGSYFNESLGEVQVVVDVQKGDQWLCFSKGTVAELKREIVRKAAAPAVAIQGKIIVERGDGGDLLAMFPDGSVEVFGSPAAVTARAKSYFRTKASSKAINVGLIEWREGLVAV